MTRSSLCILILLFVVQDDLEKADRERIVRREPLTDLERALFTPVEDLKTWETDEKADTFHLRVVPIGFRDRDPVRIAWKDSFLKYVKAQSGNALKLDFEIDRPTRLGEEFGKVLSLEKGSRAESDLVRRILLASGDLDKVDGYVLSYAGSLIADRTSVLWPHQSYVWINNRKILYTIAPTAGKQAASIHSHEFLHFFGLEDKDPSRHCILAFGYEQLDVCGACRALLGWARVADVDVRKESRIALDAGREVVRVQVSRFGESIFLENRGGLRIWHHHRGVLRYITTLDGRTSDRLTAYSTPGFRAKGRGALPVFITDVRIEDGLATFKVSPDEPLTELEKYNRSQIGKTIGD